MYTELRLMLQLWTVLCVDLKVLRIFGTCLAKLNLMLPFLPLLSMEC